MEFTVPPCALTDVQLSPIEEVVRGGARPESSQLDGWLQVGVPLVRELDEKALGDSPLAQFVQQAEAYRFFLLYFACSFRPVEGEPFTYAWFKVDLSSTASEAIAWSMTPETLTDEYKTTDKVSLSGELKLTPVTIKAERSHTSEVTVGEPYVEALNLLASNPVWELRRTKARELRGLHQLQLVARVPRNAVATARVSLEASVQRKVLGLVPYSAAFPGGAIRAISFP